MQQVIKDMLQNVETAYKHCMKQARLAYASGQIELGKKLEYKAAGMYEVYAALLQDCEALGFSPFVLKGVVTV